MASPMKTTHKAAARLPGTWTNFYDTAPLRRTLEQLIDLNTLADRNAVPKLLVSATDLEEGQIEY